MSGSFGKFIAFEERLGDLPLQCHDYALEGISLEQRHVVYAVRSGRRRNAGGQLGDPEHDPKTRGDMIWGVVWENVQEKRGIPMWYAGAAPAVIRSGAGARPTALPAYDAKWKADDRFKPLEVHPQPGAPDRLPGGSPVLVLDAVKEDGQFPLAFLGGAPLVADWRSPHAPEYSSWVHDVTADGELDLRRRARLDTAWRVTGLEVATGSLDPTRPRRYALAWNLAESPTSAGHGLVVGRPSVITEAGTIAGGLAVGFAAAERGGPFTLNKGSGDKHVLGVNEDGLAMLPLHISTGALYARPGTGLDGELQFAGFGPTTGARFDILTDVSLNFNGSTWGWVSWSPEYPPYYGSGQPGAPIPGGNQGGGRRRGGGQLGGPPPGGNPPGGDGEGGGAGPAAGIPRDPSNPVPVSGLRTHMERCNSSAYGKPQNYWSAPDLRYVPVTGGAAEAAMAKAPAVYRLEAYGSMASDGRTWLTNSGGLSERYHGRCGNGGLAVLPPELDVADVRAGEVAPAAAGTTSTTHFALVRTRLAWGHSIDIATGAPVDGVAAYLDSNKQLLVKGVASDGTTDKARAVRLCVNLNLEAGASLQLDAANSTTTLDASNLVLGVDTSSGAVQVNLPAASANPGRTYWVKNMGGAGNNVTLTPNGSDTVEGAANLAITDGKSYQVISEGSSDWLILASH